MTTLDRAVFRFGLLSHVQADLLSVRTIPGTVDVTLAEDDRSVIVTADRSDGDTAVETYETDAPWCDCQAAAARDRFERVLA